MTIKVIREPDLYITSEELTRLRYEYSKAFTHYAGPVPTFEDWVRRQQQRDTREPRT